MVLSLSCGEVDASFAPSSLARYVVLLADIRLIFFRSKKPTTRTKIYPIFCWMTTSRNASLYARMGGEKSLLGLSLTAHRSLLFLQPSATTMVFVLPAFPPISFKPNAITLVLILTSVLTWKDTSIPIGLVLATPTCSPLIYRSRRLHVVFHLQCLMKNE